MTVYFYTLGCKVNQYETQALRQLMEHAGYATAEYTVGTSDVGDGVVVVNSCTVTGESDRKLRQLLRRIRRENPRAVTVLTGCMPQAFPKEAEALTQADIVLGNAARRALPGALEEFFMTHRRVVSIPAHGTEYEPLEIEAFQGRTRAFVKIEDGCNRFCSYCIIPYSRGRVRSRSLSSLHTEVTALAEKGYREVVLVGINLTAYGQDIGCDLCDAVEMAASVPGICRVRLGSLEPDCLTPEWLGRLAACRKLCPQFHLSLQSGCDATLRRMNRHYTAAQYASLCDALRAAFPGCALTTDVMVGFAGETQEEFAASLAFVEKIGFAKLHVFAYSRRAGTPAARAPGQVTATEKARRSHRMIEAGEKSRRAYWQSLCGQETTVLAETSDGTVTEGYTPAYVPVRVAGRYPAGTLLRVRLTAAGEEACEACVIGTACEAKEN